MAEERGLPNRKSVPFYWKGSFNDSETIQKKLLFANFIAFA
jgi:hypothetical protein